MNKMLLLQRLLGAEEAGRLADRPLTELFGLGRRSNDRLGVADSGVVYGAHPALRAARELYAMALEERLQRGPVFSKPDVVKEFLVARLFGLDREIFCALWLTTRHGLIAFDEIAHGTIDQASVYPREVVKRALEQGAAAVIFCHNHPSGNQEPSASDATLTRRLKEALALIDVRVLDHVIVAGNQAVSMAERGAM